MKNTILCTLVIYLFLGLASANADTQYVTDMLVLNVRDVPYEEYNVVMRLKSNMSVEVLEKKERYFKVRTPDGKEGWVDEQYLTTSIPKTIIIVELEEKINKLEEGINELKESRGSLRNDLQSSKQKVKEIEEKANMYRQEVSLSNLKLEQVTRKYSEFVEQSNNVVEMITERDGLRATVNRLKAQEKQLQKDNTRLRSNSRWWVKFIAGGGMLLVGLMIGRLSSKRKKVFY